MKNKIIRVEFKEGDKNMLIVSERRPGENQLSHEIRIAQMKKIMIERSHKTHRGKLENLINKYFS